MAILSCHVSEYYPRSRRLNATAQPIMYTRGRIIHEAGDAEASAPGPGPPGTTNIYKVRLEPLGKLCCKQC